MESKTEGLESTTYGLSRLVLQDLFDFLHNLGSELGQDLEGLAVVGDLFGLGSSEDTGRDVFVLPGTHTRRIHQYVSLAGLSGKRTGDVAHLDSPSQSQMGHRAVQLFLGDIRQLPDLLDLGLSLGALELFHGILEELGVGRVSGILGDLSRVVFSGQLLGGKE